MIQAATNGLHILFIATWITQATHFEEELRADQS